jgi:hypothetical protein
MGGPPDVGDLFLPYGITRRAIALANDPKGEVARTFDPNAGRTTPDKAAAPPPPAPDLTDEAIANARKAARRRALTGPAQGFLTGPLGDLS